MSLKKTGIMFLLIAALLVLAIPAAFADTPVTVQTLKPTNMSVSGPLDGNVPATLNGTVNPGGSNCTVYFEYGTTPAYGSVADASPASVSGSSVVSVSAGITGLVANTLYHCRLVAVADGNYYYGHDLAFIPYNYLAH